jgi:hypothetical protein
VKAFRDDQQKSERLGKLKRLARLSGSTKNPDREAEVLLFTEKENLNSLFRDVAGF